MSKSLRRDIAQLGSQLLDEVVTERYNMHKHHPAEDIPKWFIDYVETRLLAEARNITIADIEKTKCDCKSLPNQQEQDGHTRYCKDTPPTSDVIEK